MTPDYASPEQVRGEALGTDERHLFARRAALRAAVRLPRPIGSTTGVAAGGGDDRLRAGSEPPRRSAARDARDPAVAALRAPRSIAARLLDGDLDSIVLMAMRKEPARRYASADMLRQDVERHLAGLPVLAHRGGRRYRLQKFLRRHRVEAAAAAHGDGCAGRRLEHRGRAGRGAPRASAIAPNGRSPNRTASPNFLLELFRTGEPGDRTGRRSSPRSICCSAAPCGSTTWPTSRSCTPGCST